MDLHNLLDRPSLRFVWRAGPTWHPPIAAVFSVFTLAGDILFSPRLNIFTAIPRLQSSLKVRLLRSTRLAFAYRHHYYSNLALYNYGWLLYSRPETVSRWMAGVDVTGIEHWRRALATEKAIVVFSAHVGCFLNSVFCTRATQLLDGRSLVLLSPDNETARKVRIGEQMRAVAPEVGLELVDIHVKMDAVRILRALRNRAVIASMLDYAYPFTKNKVVSFLGRKVEFPVGLIELARRVGVTYLPCFAYRRNGRTTVEFMEPFPSVETEDASTDVDAVVARVNDVLATKILAVPEQWMLWLRLYSGEPA